MDIPSYLLGKSAGGSGGTSDYVDLTNKPSINSVELVGNKTLEDLGISMPNVSGVYENSSTKPFVFDGKKKGIYFFRTAYDSQFYFKFKSSDTSAKSYSSESVIWLILNKDIVIDDLTANENFGYICSMNTFSGGLTVSLIKNSTTNTFPSGIGKGNLIIAKAQTIAGVKTFSSIPQQSTTTAPTLDAQFTNKKYVDDKLTTYAGYDATKTQVLKNINGTLTWVDEV